MTAADCRVAVETDYQLFQKFGSAAGVTNYVTGLFAAVIVRAAYARGTRLDRWVTGIL